MIRTDGGGGRILFCYVCSHAGGVSWADRGGSVGFIIRYQTGGILGGDSDCSDSSGEEGSTTYRFAAYLEIKPTGFAYPLGGIEVFEHLNPAISTRIVFEAQ